MKRSEFYAMFITMIVLFTASVSFAVSYQPQIIQPTKPYQTTVINTPSDNTYITVLDITGVGLINGIMVHGGDGNNNKYITIKITIDGVAYEIKGPLTINTQSRSAGFAITGATGNGFYTTETNCFNCPCYFKSSIKIEVKQNSGSSRTIDATVNYALE